MKSGVTARIVLVTCGSRTEARRIARRLVESRLAACVNVVTAPVESVYRWKDKVEKGSEFLLIIKTVSARLKRLEKEIKRLHSYNLPEFVAVPITAGSREYLLWVAESVAEQNQ
jgi:periplasmic divalent cation tolerance protein